AEGLATVQLVAEPVAEVPMPTAIATRPADGSVWFTSQTGEVWRAADGVNPEMVLDLRGTVSAYEAGSERGLLGITFSPADGRLFLYYTDLQAQSHVVSYTVAEDGVPDDASVRRILEIPQPGVGHKGGGMSFDEQGVLYLALGDGGGSRGRDAQDYTKLLGSIVRIVPRLDAEGYDLPADNPFLGDASKRPELWAKGLRNPWGFWRDPVTGDLWTGDVGENTVEELNRIPAGVGGLNLGWYFLEGTQVNYEGAPPDTHPPLFTYRHDEIGPAVIGGQVYRGSAIPALRGAYVFADIAGAVFAVGAGDATVRLDLVIPGVVTAFGAGADGELYVCTHTAGIQRLVPG
ncbi:MAG: PQQ-dependent sugar dehydrogenase, partial [Actinomycetota bacterium]|nr:PQQ-dependent sugar dehydrogenase [Actinomycetota bacterium]